MSDGADDHGQHNGQHSTDIPVHRRILEPESRNEAVASSQSSLLRAGYALFDTRQPASTDPNTNSMPLVNPVQSYPSFSAFPNIDSLLSDEQHSRVEQWAINTKSMHSGLPPVAVPVSSLTMSMASASWTPQTSWKDPSSSCTACDMFAMSTSAPEPSGFLESGFGSFKLASSSETPPLWTPKAQDTPQSPQYQVVDSVLASRRFSAPAAFAPIPSIELVTSGLLPSTYDRYDDLYWRQQSSTSPISMASSPDDGGSWFVGSPLGSPLGLDDFELGPSPDLVSVTTGAHELSISASPVLSSPLSLSPVPSLPPPLTDPKKSFAKRKRGTVVSEIDPVTGRRISPVTGKPTRQISKRQWPPKDADRRLWTCPVEGCELTFGRPSAVHTHMRTHDGAKPFVCPMLDCQRPFSVFSNLKRHMVVHPTVDFTHVNVKDFADVRCVESSGGGFELVWADQQEGGEDQDHHAELLYNESRDES
ncbi:hypothetical protein ACM66B_000458 [Microbotryomycetes sp. NB124-2]